MRALLIFGMTLSLGGAALAAPKAATPEEAEKRAAAKHFYDTGTLLYDRGEFLDAAKEFERAYSESPLPDILYNIAQAYDKGGDRKRAVDSYRKYCEVNPSSKDNAIARKRADVLEREWKELEAAKAMVKPQVVEAPKRALPPALPFVEPVTKHTYQTWVTVDGKPYTLLGAGARKVSLFKVYGMGLYVEDEPARALFPKLAAQAGGSDHDTLVRGDLVNHWLVMGDFGKMAVLHFVRNVSGKDTRDAYREALGETASAKAPNELKQAAEAFLALFDDVKDGEDMIIRTLADGQVIVEMHGQKRMGPKNIRLSHDIWDIWMGDKPISSDLKGKLVDRVDTLGR
jgi:tetratricopeptide (TPR) repeat protein